jgi:ubiquinone biosynthesis protein UbiJ
VALQQDSLGATLFDSVQDTLVAAAEIGGNRLLDFDPQALEACQELQGSCIAIDITDLDFQLYCHPGDWGSRLSREAPARIVDASISGRLMALVNLATKDDKVSTSIQEAVRFNGNVTLAQKLQKILSELDIDWEEALSRHTGDIAAFQIHQQMRNFGEWFRQSTDSLLQTSSEYLREEARLSPTQVEFDRFQSELGLLKNDVARSEARLQHLLSKTQPS